MKIAYKHIVNRLKKNPSIKEISNKLLQLGHENEILENLLDIEFTPNRGDCLSINGLLRDLSVFYEQNDTPDIYEGNFNELSLNFNNKDHNACTSISFLKIQIEKKEMGLKYNGLLLDYIKEFKLKQNNIFTDISNYISYETGQPTHCFDFSKLKDEITFKNDEIDNEFETLLGNKIKLQGKNAFFEQDNQIISLAGVMGGKSTSCSSKTDTVLVECASFNSEEIIGKSLKYDIQSDAAYKFERGVDPLCHNNTLRRFVKILEQHTPIKTLEIYTKEFKSYIPTEIKFNHNIINKIIGIKLSRDDCLKYLGKLGFTFKNNIILVPSHRPDIKNNNDLAEEISRVIGFDNIERVKISIPKNRPNNNIYNNKENILKGLLTNYGFYEIINNPFVDTSSKKSLMVDNPIDINKKYIRQNLKDTLIDKMLFNEKRQKDSIKLFEISNVYSINDEEIKERKVLGMIASGRIDKNFKDFSRKIDEKYISSILDSMGVKGFKTSNISRENLNSKNKNKIIYVEVDLENINIDFLDNINITPAPKKFNIYKKISEYPSSIRDLSFSIMNTDSLSQLEDLILNFSNPILKEVFIFDFFNNQKNEELKIGFRFVFQSTEKTIQDKEVENILDDIIENALLIKNVKIPGLIK